MAASGLTPTTQRINAHGPPTPASLVSPQPTADTPSAPTTPYSWLEWHPNARLIYTRDHQEANRALEQLRSNAYGFDLEWKPTFMKGQAENRVALVQIANHETILLLQVIAMQEFPSKLREFLVNPNIVKAGVGIQGDAKKLYQDWHVDISNCADLALLARTVDNDKWKGRYTSPLGLARLVAVYEDRMLAKGKITRSNWERKLTEPQQMYAANDAHAGYVIYTRLMGMMPSVSPQPDVKYYTFGMIRGRLCDSFGATWQPFNPYYDPGPPPPPREPKPPKIQKQANNAAVESSNQATASVARGPGSALALPAPQSIPLTRGASNHRGNRGFRGNHFPPPATRLQPRSPQFPPQINPNYSRLDNAFLGPFANQPVVRSAQPVQSCNTRREMRSPSAVVIHPTSEPSLLTSDGTLSTPDLLRQEVRPHPR